MRKFTIIIMLLVLSLAIGACKEVPKGCKEDLKLCPDGSVVGRVLPDCNFTECPADSTPPENNTEVPVQTDLSQEYNILKDNYTLKYNSFEEAFQAFRSLDDNNAIDVNRISYYVPGKVPREDGNPYFIGEGTISTEQNKCIRGYFNLVSGEGLVWEDVCVIVG